jgi:type I restriction enzyme, S subunit
MFPFLNQLKMISKGEIIMAAYRHIGKLSRNMEGAFNVALCRINNIEPFDRDFLELVINSDLITGELLRASERGHIPSMHTENLLSLWVPVPPPAEQKRILNEYNQLMQLCDELQYSIQQSKIENGKLLQDALRDALKKEELTTSSSVI